ncbi:MAG: hypothetical protein HC822_00575 [Oscillochloris sp.]|nr:hypothetical protein [Oscillochloris sp.]
MRLDDFFHLPAVTDAFARLMQDQAGLIVIAGLDLLPLKGEAESTLLPSGRTTIFRVLAETLLQSGDAPAALVAVDGHAFRPPRAQRRRLTVWRVPPHEPYAAYVAQAIAQGARLLLVDHLTVETSTAIVAALRAGMQVITQITSAARGVTLVREIEQLGVADHQLPDRFWVLNIRRLAQLCPACRKSQPITPLQRLTLTAVGRPGLDPDASYSVAAGCDHCQRLGRVGSVALFDIGRLERCANGAMHFEAVLALEQYARELALQGVLAFDDVVDLDAVMNRQLTQQFALHQQTLAQTNQVLERRLVELQHANEVLEQRTAAMISFQTIGQALISSTNLHDLAQRVCRHVCELCHADRAVFYMFDPAQQALILAVSGWDAAYVGRAVAGSQLLTRKHEPRAFKGWPPGIRRSMPMYSAASCAPGCVFR